MPRRHASRRLPFEGDRDYAAPLELVIVDELELEPLDDGLYDDELADVDVDDELRAIDRDGRRSSRVELPERAPLPLGALELAWHLEQFWMEPYFARSIELAGGFRPMLERAGLKCDSAEL